MASKHIEDKEEDPVKTTPSESPPSTPTPPEKDPITTAAVDLDRIGETGGYILEEEKLKEKLGLAADATLKKSPKGIVLIPQPTSDPEDPLNWSRRKKALILLMLTATSFTADYSAATATSAIIPQAEEWHISPDTVNHATAGNAFMIAVGGLTVVWLSAYFGRLPVLFYFMVLSFACSAWVAAAKSFESFMAARILNGLFCCAGVSGGLMWIKDVWFFHEHPRRVNIWSAAIVLSPFLGPQFMAAIISVSSWRTGMWLTFGIIGFSLLLVVLFGDESFYPRHLMPDRIPPRKSRLLRLVGVEQYRSRYTTNTFLEAGSRLGWTATRLPVFLSCLCYFLDFPWLIANNSTISVFIIPAYNFDFRNLAAIMTAPVVGAILGLVVGHFLFDIIGSIYAKYHEGRIEPEARLIILWLVLPLKIIGYNLIGVTLQHAPNWSWWVLAVGWAMHNFATIVTTAALGAYLIDAYPEASGESAAWLNFARTLGGFIVLYFQIGWATSAGTQTAFGIESAIMGINFLIVVFLQFFGARLRRAQGLLHFKTN